MIKIIAIMCSLANALDCHEMTVTSSQFDNLSISDCYNVPKLVEWAKRFPQYRLARWKCRIGGAAEGRPA